jgi:hypothetical protein
MYRALIGRINVSAPLAQREHEKDMTASFPRSNCLEPRLVPRMRGVEKDGESAL